MLLIFLDTETTGLDPEKHRIVDIAFKAVDSISQKTLLTYEALIAQPQEVWGLADPESSKITGLSFEKTLHGHLEKAVASEIVSELNHLKIGEVGGIFICQNPSFDKAFFCQLVHVETQERFEWPYHWCDLASMYWAFRLLSDGETAKTLTEMDLKKDRIAHYFGLPEEQKPHGALNGVNHLLSCYEAIFGKFKPA